MAKDRRNKKDKALDKIIADIESKINEYDTECYKYETKAKMFADMRIALEVQVRGIKEMLTPKQKKEAV